MSCLKSLIKHIIKIAVIALFLSQLAYPQQDTLQTNSSTKEDSVFVMQKSPWGAVLRSAIIPGWGQIYNQSYLKVPIVWGVLGWLGYEWYQNNKLYKQSQDLYNQTNIPEFLSYKTIYQDQRDLFAIYIGLAYVLNLVDAYVDAELFDFSVKQDFRTNSPMLNMRIKF